jgi:HEAT repeat protein
MGQSRNRDTVQVNEEGKKQLIKAKAKKTKLNQKGQAKIWTYLDIATASNVSEATVKRFFARKDVDRPYAEAIAKALDLKLEDLINTTPPEDTPPVPPENKPDNSINWPDICRGMLQKQATSNKLLHQDEDTKKEREQIYVPLALVQRRKVEKRDKRNFVPEAGTQLYQPNHEQEQKSEQKTKSDESQYEQEQKFEHGAFLSQILERGEGKTKGRQVALIGEPGAGKTTLLQTIAFWILDQNLGLPIWISLADLGRNGKEINLQQYICEIWLKQAVSATEFSPEKQADFQQQMELGRVWLLLDGADEMSVGTQFHQPLETIAQQLKGWIQQKTRVVLTCRLNVWQADVNALADFETYRLLDFDYPSQVHQFINNWFGNGKGREKGERLKTELAKAEKARLQDLIQNPLRLTLLCSIWQREEGNLPETKAELYQQFVNYIYNWKINQFSTTKKQQRELNSGLGKLARRDIDAGGSRFRLREDFIIKELGDPDEEDSLFYLALKLGWLNHVGIATESPTQKVYAFYHATFEEYFAALAVDDWTYFFKHYAENPRQGTYRIFEPQWKEVILLWLGREDVEEEQKEEFIQALYNFQDGCGEFYQYRAFFLAAAGIREFKERKLSDEVIKKLIRYGFGYFDQDQQKWLKFNDTLGDAARKVIPETNHQKAIQVLVNLIHTSDYEYIEDIKVSAAESLLKIDNGNQDAIQTLVDLINMSDDDDNDMFMEQYAALEILGNIGTVNQEVIQALVDFIHNSDDQHMQIDAAESLLKINNGNKDAIQTFIDVIGNSDAYAQNDAAESLLKIGNYDDNEESAYDLVYLLDKLDDDKAAEKLVMLILGKQLNCHQEAIQNWIDLIDRIDDEWTKYLAVSILVEIDNSNNKYAIQTLIKLISSFDDSLQIECAVESLGKIGHGNTEAINVLVDLIRTCDYEDMGILAAQSLGKIDDGNLESINYLINIIYNSNPDYKYTKTSAARSLGEIANDNENAIQALVYLIRNSDNEYTKITAAESLGKIGHRNTEAIQELVNLIRNSNDQSTKNWSIKSLVKIGNNNQEVTQVLVDLIRNYDDESTKYWAATRLVEIGNGNQEAIQVLLDKIHKYDDESTKYWIATTFKNITDNEPMKMVITDLHKDLPKDVYKYDAEFVRKYYEIFWNLSQNLNYPEFYAAWQQGIKN